MKKYLGFLIAAFMAACVTCAFAQGTVVFNNGTGLVNRLGYPSDVPMPKGGGEVQLYWAPAGTPYTPWNYLLPQAWFAANPGWSLGPVVGFTTSVPGRFDGGAITLSPLAPGGTIDYVVVGWTGNAQTMEQALATGAMLGVSGRFTSPTGNPTTVPPGFPVPLAGSFGGLTITIPEPACFALAAMGAASFLALRSRDRKLPTNL